MTGTHDATLFVSGALAAGYGVAALFFVRFYRQTRDRLFALFATSFVLLLVQRTALALATDLVSDIVWFDVIRLAAFALIIVAIIDKNRSTRG